MKLIDDAFKKMPESYKKNLFKYQIDNLKVSLNEEEEKGQREFLMSQRISSIAQSMRGIEMEEMPKLVYNPKETPSQNLLQSIMWVDIRDSNLLIRNSEIVKVAKEMEKNREIQKEIARLIDDQEKEIDIITSHIKKAKNNVKEAKKDILIANMYHGGEKVEFDSNGELKSNSNSPPPA